MSDLVAWLRAQLDLDEAHAGKDLWCVERATALGQWEARYGHNLPYSILQAGDVEVGRLTADRHAADLMLVSRMVRSAKARAERVLADVDAKRRIIDEHAVVDNGGGELDSRYCSCCYADRGYNADVSNRTGEGPLVWCQTVRLLALPYADRPGYEEVWKP